MEWLSAYWERHKGFILGRAALSVGIWAVSVALGVSALVPAMIAVGLGAAFGVTGRLLQHYNYQNEMVDLYRDDIAAQLGIAPEQVGRAALKEAAKGNDVIAQALEREHKRSVISIGTTLLSAAVTSTLLYFFVDAGQLHQWASTTLGPHIGQLANLIGLGTVSGVSGLVLHHGLSTAIDYKIGTHKAAAHDLMLGMQHRLARGQGISAMQVYGVLVAEDPVLAQRIQQHFGRSYEWLPVTRQKDVLAAVGVGSAMQQLATHINNGETSPGHLAYLAGDSPELAQTHEQPSAKSSFVQKLGLAPRHAAGHAEQIAAERAAAGERALA